MDSLKIICTLEMGCACENEIENGKNREILLTIENQEPLKTIDG